MKNRIKISTDGINVYATLDVNASKIGVRILGVMLFVEIIVVLILLSQVKPDEIISMIIPIVLVLIFFIGLPIKYFLWNVYGKEELIVNAKSISWAYDYGFFKTNLKTVNYDRLGTGYERVQILNDEELGKLIFYNYRESDNLQEMIHSTTVLLKKDEIEVFDRKISEVFSNELLDSNGFIPFSIN
ncbi:MAG: hypothetical protein H6567_10565 [Lewinellaceae bacterium]|nr:hypothetical protein [Lewinellaceae bacterium]